MQNRAQHCLSLMLHVLSSSNIIAYPYGHTPLSDPAKAAAHPLASSLNNMHHLIRVKTC